MVKQTIFGALMFSGGLGIGIMSMSIIHIQAIEVIKVPRNVIVREQCPEWVPHTPMTDEELKGLARAQSNLDAEFAQREALLLQRELVVTQREKLLL